jgi:ribosomal protein S27E
VNVTCNKCGKKYVIADDKVVGKSSVKIRCKQCQNLIAVTVSEGGVGVGVAGAAAPPPLQDWEEEKTRARPPLDTAATWYAMIAGKQQGPFDVATLARRVGGGEVTLRTYLWKPGMGDWKRASEVPEVSTIFAGVSVGATATGQTQLPASTAAQKPTPAARDVAVANEVPSPEVTRKKSTTVVYGGAEAKATLAAAQAAAAEGSRPAAAAAPLNDLFSDVGTPSGLHSLHQPISDLAQQPANGVTEGSTSGQLDPFAQIAGPVKEGEAPPPGEATKFFIARAGVNKRNPPWKIALFIGGGIGIPVFIGWMLLTFGVVSLPTVTATHDDGTTTQESFFSPTGFSGLKDSLTGESARKKAAAEQKEHDRLAAIANAAKRQNTGTTGSTATREPEDEPVKPPKPQDPNLAALYGNDDGPRSHVPKIRKNPDDQNSAAVNASGLSPETAMKVVNEKQKAFEQCVETALHRNPKLAVGNIFIVLNIGPSGAVKGASVEPKKFEGSDWATCMVGVGRRIVFPTSDGDTQLELPFKVGVAMGP